jgi:hypothetical protein
VIFFFVLQTALAGTLLTYKLSSYSFLGKIRASAISSILFYAILSPIDHPFVPMMQACFFGASFVGMTDPRRLGFKGVALAGIIYGILFFLFVPKVANLGGALGMTAFLASSLVYSISKRVGTSIKP